MKYLAIQDNQMNNLTLKEDQKKLNILTIWIVADLETGNCRLILTLIRFLFSTLDSMKYLTQKDDQKKLNILTIWIVADLDTPSGRDVLASAVSHVKTSNLVRIGVIHNPKSPDASSIGLIPRTVQAALQTLDSSAARQVIGKILKPETVKKLESGKKSLADYDIPGKRAQLPTPEFQV